MAATDFNEIDADGSGVITRGEFALFFQSRGWSKDKVDETFQEMDYNSDG